MPEASPDESAEALNETRMVEDHFRLSRLPENNRKSEAELWAMVTA